MHLKTAHIRFISIATIVIMLWNVIGWMGLKEVLEHTHSDSENSFCTMNYCTCLVEHEGSICTCHHKDENGTEALTFDQIQSHDSKHCFYDTPHKSVPIFTIGIVLNDFNGYFGSKKPPAPGAKDRPYYISNAGINNLLLTKKLFRPPIS